MHLFFLKKLFDLPSFEQIKKMPYKYYKRDGFRFFFKNEYHSFDIRLEGKELYEFVDQYDIGDEIKFYE